MGLLHAFLSISLRADQVVGGTAINLLAVGITGYVFIAHYGQQGTPADVPRVPEVSLPLIQEIPFVGDAIGEANLLTSVALILVPLLALYLFRTPGGLRLRSVGEKPRAADSVGVPVMRTRYLAVVSSGILAALGGVYLSVGLVGTFNPFMTDGRGFIALAAVIFGNWRPGARSPARSCSGSRARWRSACRPSRSRWPFSSRRCPTCLPSWWWQVSSAVRDRRPPSASPT